MHDDRLEIAWKFGAGPVRLGDGDPAGQIIDATGGTGAGCGVKAVDYTKVLLHPAA
jgi:glutathione-independent formaldehyde dehydrogenase